MANKITVVNRQPKNAFSRFEDVPGNQDNTYAKDFNPTTRGIKSAIAHAAKCRSDYDYSHGRGAVQSVTFQVDGKTVQEHVLSYCTVYLDKGQSIGDAIKFAVRDLVAMEKESDAAFEAKQREEEAMYTRDAQGDWR